MKKTFPTLIIGLLTGCASVPPAEAPKEPQIGQLGMSHCLDSKEFPFIAAAEGYSIYPNEYLEVEPPCPKCVWVVRLAPNRPSPADEFVTLSMFMFQPDGASHMCPVMYVQSGTIGPASYTDY